MGVGFIRQASHPDQLLMKPASYKLCRPNLGCALVALPRLMTRCGEPYPIRSNTAAMPIPPPMQSVTSP